MQSTSDIPSGDQWCLETLSRRATIRFTQIGEFLHTVPPWNWAPAPLTDYDFWIALDGHALLTVDGTQTRVAPGMVFLLRPGARVFGRCPPDQAVYQFRCHFDLLDDRGVRIPPRRVSWPRVPTQVHDIPRLHECARTIEHGTRIGTSLALRQAELAGWQILLHCAAENAGQGHGGIDPRIRRVRRAILEHPSQSMTVTEMASMARLSPTQFARLFRRQIGVSPTRYAVQNRIHHACRMLEESDMTLAQIADSLGYCNQHFFSRQFRQITGQSPGVYRQSTLRSTPGREDA